MSRALIFIIGGAIFGAGLAISGMTRPEVVIDFLQLDDLGLLLVMGFGIVVTLPAFRWRRPLGGGESQPFGATATGRTILGAAIFGIGWGISGACPGAAFASLGTGNWPILAAIGAMLAGAWVQGIAWPERDA